jgi:hypothetical protein
MGRPASAAFAKAGRKRHTIKPRPEIWPNARAEFMGSSGGKESIFAQFTSDLTIPRMEIPDWGSIEARTI